MLDRLANRVGEIYVHIDFDVFAPEVAPGIVDEPVPEASSADAEAILRATAERVRIKAAMLVTYAPALACDDGTLRLGLRLIELIGECASRAQGWPPRRA